MWPAIVTGIFTLLAGVAGSFGLHLYSDWRKRKALRIAIVSEISSIIEICEIQYLRNYIAAGAKGKIKTLTFEAPSSYRAVFDGNTGNIGLLGASEARDIVCFYQMANYLVSTFKPGRALSDPKTSSMEGFSEALRVYSRAEALGRSLMRQKK
jgi:hypothetical protein